MVGAEKPEEEKGEGASFPARSWVGMLSSSETFDLRVPRPATRVEITKAAPQ